MRFLILLVLSCSTVLASIDDIISPSNRITWVKGKTDGSQYDFSNPGLLTAPSNVVTHGVDNTGATDVTSALQTIYNNGAAIGKPNLYFPNGVYKIGGTLTFDHNNIRIIGESTNVIINLTNGGNFFFGHASIATGPAVNHYYATNAMKGQTNLSFYFASTNGDTVTVGDSFYLSSLIEPILPDPTWSYIYVYKYPKDQYDTLFEHVVVHSVSSTNVTIKTPLRFDWTNDVRLRETSLGANSSFLMRSNVVFANFTITNSYTTLYSMVEFSMCRDSIMTNVTVKKAANYNVVMYDDVNCGIEGCDVGETHETTFQSNHGGLLNNNCTGLLVENCIFRRQFPMIEWNAGVGGVVFGCFFESNQFILGPDNHGPHPMMYLFEGNIMPMNAWKLDGYFGSSSHHTVFRNYAWFVDMKRWSTHIAIVGNVLGDQYFSTQYTNYSDLLQSGLPNIGNGSFVGTAPPAAWNWPGPGSAGETNPGVVIVGDWNSVTTINGNFLQVPASPFKGAIFQNNSSTQTLYGFGAVGASVTISTATATEATFSGSVTASNGYRLYAGGPDGWQSKQIGDISNCVVHANRFYTNVGGTIVYSSGLETGITNSIFYPTVAPSWSRAAAAGYWPFVSFENGTWTNDAAARYSGATFDTNVAANAPRIGEIKGIRLRPN